MVALESARVLLSGSSGLLGTALSVSLKTRGFDVTRLVRGRVSSEDQIHWDPMRPPNADSLSGFDGIIHLSGETVVGRWTAAKKAKIRDSRITSTRNLVHALTTMPRRPRVLIAASAIFETVEVANKESLRLNLWETNRNQLLLAGLAPDHIELPDICTRNRIARNIQRRRSPYSVQGCDAEVVDRVNGRPLLIAVGPDGKSFRVFVSQIDGKDAEFFLKGDEDPSPAIASSDPKVTPASANSDPKKPGEPETKPSPSAKTWALLDTTTASEWDFQGCAISGASQGKCLERVPALKDYWFDWRNYHPDTTIYKR